MLPWKKHSFSVHNSLISKFHFSYYNFKSLILQELWPCLVNQTLSSHFILCKSLAPLNRHPLAPWKTDTFFELISIGHAFNHTELFGQDNAVSPPTEDIARSLFADSSYHFLWLRKPKLLDRYLTITVAKCDTERRQCNSGITTTVWMQKPFQTGDTLKSDLLQGEAVNRIMSNDPPCEVQWNSFQKIKKGLRIYALHN